MNVAKNTPDTSYLGWLCMFDLCRYPIWSLMLIQGLQLPGRRGPAELWVCCDYLPWCWCRGWLLIRAWISWEQRAVLPLRLEPWISSKLDPYRVCRHLLRPQCGSERWPRLQLDSRLVQPRSWTSWVRFRLLELRCACMEGGFTCSRDTWINI
jgi:hypothetical protein